jgi:dipeptidyl aminopeptidase/acylaminoacyl peptidase
MLARILLVFFFSVIAFLIVSFSQKKDSPIQKGLANETKSETDKIRSSNPLSIENIKNTKIDGGEIEILEVLDPGSNYKRYIASYTSEGLKINGLLTVPDTEIPAGGFPSIIFGHGYIPPSEYRSTERYVAYVDSLARAGYVVFKIDYRGHGNSEGSPEGAYFSPSYTIDALNAADAIAKLDYINPSKIGAWGHSMSGMVLTRALTAKPDTFKAAAIWGGVIGSYEDIHKEWWSKRRRPIPSTTPSQLNANRPSRQAFISRYGEPDDSNDFWRSISPKAYIENINTPILLEHGEADGTVPVSLSVLFSENLSKAGKIVELHTYPGGDHDISSPNFEIAMQRTVDFFDKYLK